MEQYYTNVGQVLRNGVFRPDRTGTGTFSIKGQQFRHHMDDGFPLDTTKKTAFAAVIKELIWFLSGDTSQRALKAMGCSIWDEWADAQGRLGPVYGAMWRRRPASQVEYEWKQIEKINGVELIGVDETIEFIKKVSKRRKLSRRWDEHSNWILRQSGKSLMSGLADEQSTKVKKLMTRYTSAAEAWAVILTESFDSLLMMGDASLINYKFDARWLHFEKFLEDFSKMPGNELVGVRDYKVYRDVAKGNGAGVPASIQFIPEEYELFVKRAHHRTYSTTRRVGFVYVPVFYIDQIAKVEHQLVNNPNSRRIIVDGWEPSLLPNDLFRPDQQGAICRQALPPCHTLFQFFVDPVEGSDVSQLSLHMYQRSQDKMLGEPFNIASYAALLMLMAKNAGLKAGELIVSTGDSHVYSNHVETATKQIRRKRRPLPTLKLVGDTSDLSKLTMDNFVLENYTHGPVTRYPVAV